jgi:hypothetical protein
VPHPIGFGVLFFNIIFGHLKVFLKLPSNFCFGPIGCVGVVHTPGNQHLGRQRERNWVKVSPAKKVSKPLSQKRCLCMPVIQGTVESELEKSKPQAGLIQSKIIY